MARPSPAQKDVVERVMHEFKHGELKQNGGAKVRNPKQAIAIALREAGSSNQESPAENRDNLAKTKRKERRRDGAGQTRADLYALATSRNVPGRSRMSKDELARALNV